MTPVPYAKLLPLCIARSAEGMIGSIIMPYVNEMILSFGVNENDVGIWSAIAVSINMSLEIWADDRNQVSWLQKLL